MIYSLWVLEGNVWWFAGYRCDHLTGPGGMLGGCVVCSGWIG